MIKNEKKWWTITTSCGSSSDLLSYGISSMSQMKYLSYLSINVDKEMDLEILPSDETITIREKYKSHFLPREILVSDVKRIFLESSALLSFCNNDEMIVPSLMGFDTNDKVWKFVVSKIYKKQVLNSHPVLVLALTILCTLYSFDFETTIKKFEEVLLDKAKYEECLWKILNHLTHKEIANEFKTILKYDWIWSILTWKQLHNAIKSEYAKNFDIDKNLPESIENKYWEIGRAHV